MDFKFWKNWLLLISLVVIVLGLVLVFFNQSPLFDLVFNRQIDPVFWSSAQLDPAALAFRHWSYGVLGATLAGWGVFLAFIVSRPFSRHERWAWNCVVAGLGLWYVLDTGLSISSGVWFNAAFNTVLLILLLPPLAITRRYFKKEGG